jgi:hypothetical protein
MYIMLVSAKNEVFLKFTPYGTPLYQHLPVTLHQNLQFKDPEMPFVSKSMDLLTFFAHYIHY